MLRSRSWLVAALGVVTAFAGMPGRVAAQEAQAHERMPADAHPVFEVAAIKRSDPNSRNESITTHGRHIVIENKSVQVMVMFAYGMNAKQIVGGPDWMGSERFDVDGVPDMEGEPSVPQMQSMLQGLLRERFGLKVHREQRELAVYAITVAKGGPKMRQSQGDPNGAPDESDHVSAGQREMKFANQTMANFALVMQLFLERPVVDQTGLAGRWDFDLKWTFDDRHAPEENSAPGLFSAFQEQLGLKLESVKAPVDVLVVDAVERPGAN